MTWVGDATTATTAAAYTAADVANNVTYGHAFGRLEGSFVHTAKLAFIKVSSLNGVAMMKTNDKVYSGSDLSLSESTKFVVKSAGGAVTSYTGYTALPALTASYVDYLDNDGDGFADIVYIGKAVFAADNVTGWVLKWTPFNWANGYDLITVYVDGEPVTVNVKHETIVTGVDANGVALRPGLYTFKTQVDANGVTYSEVYMIDQNASNWMGEAVESYSNDATAIKVKDANGYTQTIGLTDVVIYNVLADGTVVKADASCIAAGDYIIYSKVSNKPARWVLAVADDSRYQKPEDLAGKRIATELMGVCTEYFKERNIPVNINYSWGATEAKVVEGLADAIVEVTETETTIRAHDLRVIDEVLVTNTVLIANAAAMQDPEKRRKIEQTELDAEAARVVKSMPKWKPATVKDKTVRCRYTVPVTFKLQ